MTVTITTSLLLLFLVPSFILGNPVHDEPEETLLLDSSDDSDYEVLDTATTLGDQGTTTTAALVTVVSTATTATTTQTTPTQSTSGTDIPSTSTSSEATTSTTIPTTTTFNETTTSTTSSSTSTVSTTTSTATSSVTSAPVPASPPIPGWGLALVCLAAAAAVFAGSWLLFLRYRRAKIPLAIPAAASGWRRATEHQRRRRTADSAVLVAEFEQTARARLLSGEIVKEFEMVQEFSAGLNMQKTRDVGQSEINMNRNRFIDIIPFDDNYVSLSAEQGMPPSSYVNASYLDNMEVLDKVIVTQGPKQNTVLDFWRMVLEKRCRHIVMLTNCQEQGRVKCFQYWPPSGQMLHFDDISLFTCEETELHPGLVLRRVEVSLEDEAGPGAGEVVEVRQLHLTSWPDHGVPHHTDSILAFIRVAAAFRDTEYTVVHCSAGVGRTGTYLALASLTQQVEAGCETVDVLGTVLQLRARRPKMVQTQEQYTFLYQALATFVTRWRAGDTSSHPTSSPDTVLDAGIDNFGFEHVKL